MQHETINTKVKAAVEFSPREYIFKYLYLLPWLILGVVIAYGVTYTRLRYINPIYSASGKVLIKTDKPVGSSGSGDKLGDIITTTVSTKAMDDQIELIRSTAMARIALRKANVQQSYYYKGNVRNRLIHNPSSPVQLRILSVADSLHGLSFEIKAIDNNHFIVNQGGERIAFGSEFQLAAGRFIMDKSVADFGLTNEFICTWTPERDLARSLAGQIQVGTVSKGANVLSFVFYSEHPRIAEDVVNGFLSAYQEFSLQDKREGANSALSFIDDQLMQARADLVGVETQLQGFREGNKVVGLPEQASGYYEKMQASNQQISEQTMKLKLLEFLINYIRDAKNAGKSIPLNTGLQDATMVASLITEHNKLQLQREISLQTIPKDNPIIRDMDMSMNKLRNEILLTLGQLKDSYQTALKSMQQAEQMASSELRAMPSKDRRLLEITRQQKVMEELYSTLLQRKIQTSISTASTLSNIQILEPGYSGGWPVSPDSRSMYTTAILIGLAIPIGFALLKDVLNDKINSRADIEKFSTIPILSEIGHSDNKDVLIVSTKDRKYISEQFRILRTNLQYILPRKEKSTILVTSSVSGEGKTFVSTNLAGVLAIAGKKVVVMEFDIRKPKVLKGFNMDRKGQKGITNYLMGNANLDEIIIPVEGFPNLFIISCGPVPPNPSELILDPLVKQLFDEVKERFDHVVIDSAPVGLVSDGFELGVFADATAYIIRHNYSHKKQVQFIDEIYQGKRLPHMSLVINDLQLTGGYGRYYGYKGYGYAGYYGYTSRQYASDYFDVEGRKRRGWMRMFKG
ncbi:MAG: GumC family protein [bacterium]